MESLALQVDNNSDSGEGSLREAIAIANENPGKDTVTINTDVAIDSSILISDSVIIETPFGASITQNGNDRIFNISDGNDDNQVQIDLYRLSLSGGLTEESGGAILSYEDLSIVDSEIFDNSSIRQGAGIFQQGGQLNLERTRIFDNKVDGSESSTSAGGGLYANSSNLTVVNSVFENNEAEIAGGIGLDGSTANILATTIDNNFGEGVSGFNSEISISESNIQGNDSSSGLQIFVDENSTIDTSNTTISNDNLLVVDGIILPTTTVYRFQNKQTGSYKYSSDIDQYSEAEYSFEGKAFSALESDTDPITGEKIEGVEPVHTYSRNSTGSEFQTINETEKSVIDDNQDFEYEGVDFFAFESQTENFPVIPIYRVLNTSSGEHLFTSDQREVDYIQSNLPEFSSEGEAYQVFDS